MSKPQTTWLVVTPEMATKFLECNIPNNRNMLQDTVNVFARDMKEGRWVATHQGIGFEGNPFSDMPNAKLQDGQHRLWAIIESGASIYMPVTVGLPPEAISGIDANRPRSVVDVAKISGWDTVTNRHASCANAMARRPSHYKISRSQYIEFLKEHWEAINFTVKTVFPTNRRGITAVVQGVVARAYYHVPHDVLKEFGHVLFSGQYNTPESQVIALLRNWLMNLGNRGPRGGGQETREEIYWKTERALYAYWHRETLSKLYESAEEYFPLAGEKPVKALGSKKVVSTPKSRRAATTEQQATV